MKKQSVEVLDDADDFERRLSWILFKQEQASIWPEPEEKGWRPGIPLYNTPDSFYQQQWIRPMFQVIHWEQFNNVDRVYFNSRCEDCEVYWVGEDPCFMCGEICEMQSWENQGVLYDYLRRNTMEHADQVVWQGLAEVAPPQDFDGATEIVFDVEEFPDSFRITVDSVMEGRRRMMTVQRDREMINRMYRRNLDQNYLITNDTYRPGTERVFRARRGRSYDFVIMDEATAVELITCDTETIEVDGVRIRIPINLDLRGQNPNIQLAGNRDITDHPAIQRAINEGRARVWDTPVNESRRPRDL